MGDGNRFVLGGISFLTFAALACTEAKAQTPPARDSVLAQMRKVADWQNRNLPVSSWDHDWTQAPFFAGLLALNRASGEEKWFDLAKAWSIKARWKVKDNSSKSWRNPDNRACT